MLCNRYSPKSQPLLNITAKVKDKSKNQKWDYIKLKSSWIAKEEIEVTQSCSTLYSPMDSSLPGSSIHRIFQARVLKWVAISFSTIWPSNLTPKHIPEETKIERDTYIPLFTAALFTIAKTWKQPRWPLTVEWIKKLWYIYTVEYYSAIKRNTLQSVLMRWMNLEPII